MDFSFPEKKSRWIPAYAGMTGGDKNDREKECVVLVSFSVVSAKAGTQSCY
jgi:hypothetical protein